MGKGGRPSKSEKQIFIETGKNYIVDLGIYFFTNQYFCQACR